MKKIHLFFQLIKILLDFVLIIIGGILAYHIRFTEFFVKIKPVMFDLTFKQWIFYLVIISLISIFIFSINGIYSLKSKNHFFIEATRILFSLTASYVLFLVYGFLVRYFFESRFLFFSSLTMSFLLLLIERMFLRYFEKILAYKNPKILNNVLIIGKNIYTQKLKNFFEKNISSGYRVIKLINNFNINQIKYLVKKYEIDDIILGVQLRKTQMEELANLVNEKAINLKYIPTGFELSIIGTSFEDIKGIPLIEFKRTPLEGWGKIYKRIFDFVVSLVLLILLSPLFLIIAILIKLDSEGPVFARIPHRVGFRGKPFYMYKFRTMIKDAAKLKKKLLKLNERKGGGPLFKLKNDPRVTRIGRFLRKTRLDEFPQLINVFKGEMSLVGPRPHEVDEVKKYKTHHRQVLGIKPGITGLAQISGAHNLPFELENKLDLYYIRNWSPWLDIKILFRTFIFMIKDRSAV